MATWSHDQRFLKYLTDLRSPEPQWVATVFDLVKTGEYRSSEIRPCEKQKGRSSEIRSFENRRVDRVKFYLPNIPRSGCCKGFINSLRFWL
jgi:hypothetical protein